MLQPAILLIVLGLIMGPGYYGYCEHLSGEELQTMELSQRAERWEMPDGSIQRFHGRLAYRPTQITLRPDLNRVRLVLDFQFQQEPAAEEVEYLVTLATDDYPVIQAPISLRPSGAVTVPLRILTVETAGDYVLTIEEVGKRPHPAATVTVHLRGRIEELVRPLMWLGYGLFLVGLGLMAYALAASRQDATRG
jgi:hypothetical protein